MINRTTLIVSFMLFLFLVNMQSIQADALWSDLPTESGCGYGTS